MSSEDVEELMRTAWATRRSSFDAEPAEARRALTWAAKQLVRSAWLLDDYGDLGNREKVIEAHGLFAEAVEELGRHYP